jgi:acyl-coenzyme A synthetase/AMP-(fatty) acid ligase/acyl carrier protein
VIIADDHDRYDVAATARLICEHRVTKVLQPVVAMQQLARHAVDHPEDVASLRELITTGDRLVITPEIRAMAEALPGVRFDDHYGSTEINVVSAPRLEQPAQDWPERPALGNPVAASRIYVLDAALRPTPKNVPGDIYVGGGPLARGYLGQGGLTAGAFLPDPFAGTAGARMYRTGDTGRWRSGGALEFLGRADFQVKIRGYRVEPGEIEALLREHADVSQAVVVATRASEPDAALVAYVIGGDPDVLRDYLAERLPAHLVPQAVVVLEEFPLTTTGKIDRKRLPDPGAVEPPFIAPRDEVEELIAGIWSEVLGVGRIGVRDDFFRLGGHSMLVTRVVYQLNRSFGIDLPLRTVFDRPTIEALAAAVRERRG